MRILHCLHNYHPARGGAEWLMKNISEKLQQRGHEIRILATTAHSVEDYFLPGKGKNLMRPGAEIIDGIPVERVGFSRRGAGILNLARGAANRIPLPCGNRIKMVSWGPRSRSYYRKLLEMNGVDLLAACPLPTMNVRYAWKAAGKKNLPLIIIPCFHTEDRWTFHNPIYFGMLRDAAAVISLTDWEKSYLRDKAGIPEEKICTLGVGIDIEAAGPMPDIRSKYGITQKETVIFLGQHGIHKGIIPLIEAMEIIWTTHPNTALIVAGNPTDHTLRIEAKIDKLTPENRNNVYLIKGFPEAEKRSLLRAADVFVSVSPFESFGIVFLEAWREKLPVIGCRIGGSSKLIDEYKDGFLVDAGKPRELAAVMIELLDNEDVRKKMGLAGYEKVKKHFAWDKIVDRWEKVYHDALH